MLSRENSVSSLVAIRRNEFLQIKEMEKIVSINFAEKSYIMEFYNYTICRMSNWLFAFMQYSMS